jgi:glucosyl-3-phosphoglycerate synthase
VKIYNISDFDVNMYIISTQKSTKIFRGTTMNDDNEIPLCPYENSSRNDSESDQSVDTSHKRSSKELYTCSHCKTLPFFSANDFLPLDELAFNKKNLRETVSVVIPALNEAATIAAIITSIKTTLMDGAGIVDEILVIDGGSSDATIAIAQAAGATVYAIDAIPLLPGEPEHVYGKGAALWKSLLKVTGSIVVCIDADIIEFNPCFVYGLIGPLLRNKKTVFSKAFYRRPLKIDNAVYENYGGRVTEILVRPLLSMFCPDLACVFQPLSGEYAFKKDAAMSLSFSSGYGVEIGLLFDIYKKFGLSSCAQVDMGVRYHRNRPVYELAKISFGVLKTILNKLEADNVVSCAAPRHQYLMMPGKQGIEHVAIEEVELPPHRP